MRFDAIIHNRAKYKAHAIFLIKATVFLVTIFTAVGVFIPQHQIDESLVIRNSALKQDSAIVAGGAPIKWSMLIKRQDITAGNYLVKLPQGAANVKISALSASQAKTAMAVKAQPTDILNQRAALALNRSKNNQTQFLLAGVFASIARPFKNAAVNLSCRLSAQPEGAVIINLLAQQAASSTKRPAEAQDSFNPYQPYFGPNILKSAGSIFGIIGNNLSYGQKAQAAEAEIDPPPAVAELLTVDQLPTVAEQVPVVEPPVMEPVVSQADIASLIATTTIPEVVPQVEPPVLAPATSSAEVATSTPSSAIPEDTLPTVASTTDTHDASSTEFVKVDFETPAPVITEQDTSRGKIVTIASADGDASSTGQLTLIDVLASATIPPIYKVGQQDKIHIKWKNNGNQNMAFQAYDTDSDGYLDYVEWTVPHLSEQIFEIIFISRAFQLDQDQNIIADVYSQTSAKDGNYADIPAGNYVRATFNGVLDNTKDLTVYARSSVASGEGGPNPSIEVFPVYTDSDGNQTEGPLLATVSDGLNPDFTNIDHDGKYRVLLKNLSQPTDTFDLHIVSVPVQAGGIQIDQIIDPAGVTYYWTGASGASINTATNWTTDVNGACGDSTGGVVPGASDTAIFDSVCNTSSTIDTSWSITALTLGTGYTATATQTANVAISGDLTVTAGTLAVGTYDLAVTGNSTVNGNLTINTSANNGWTTTNLTLGATGTITSNATTYYNQVTVSGTLSPDATGTYTVAGLSGGYPYYSLGSYYLYTYHSGSDYYWAISTSLGTLPTNKWYKWSGSGYPTITGSYSQWGSYTGTATVANVTASGIYYGATSKITLSGSFTQTAGGYFNAGPSLITVNGNGSFTADGTASQAQFNSASLVLNGNNTITYTHLPSNYSQGFYNLTVGQSTNTTTVASSFNILNILTVGSGTFTGNKSIYLTGANPLSFDSASTVSVGRLDFFGTNSKTIPALVRGYDCSLELGQASVTQTGNIVLNTTNSLLIDGDSEVNRADTWNTSGYNLTVGGNLTIGNSSDIQLKKLDATGSGGRTSTITVTGNWLNYGNGTASSTFVAANSTVIFNSTSTGHTITSGSSTPAFNNLTFNGTGGAWTLQDNLIATSTTLTQGTLVDNGKTVTVNGDILISNASGSVLTSTGNWIQAFSGNISNPTYTNCFKNLTIAGAGVTTTLTGKVNVGTNYPKVNGSLTMGPGTINGGNQILSLLVGANDALTVNNVQIGTALSAFYFRSLDSANITQKAITLPNNFVANYVYIWAGDDGVDNSNIGNITATGDFNFGNNPIALSSGYTGTPVRYLDMGSSAFTSGVIYFGYSPQAWNGYLKLGSSANHSIAGFALYPGSTATGHKLDFGNGTTTITGNINFTSINTTPGTSTVVLASTSPNSTVTSVGNSFYNLTLNGSGSTYTLQDALTVAHNLTLTAGTLDTKSGSNYAVSIGSASPTNGDYTQTTTAKFLARSSTITLNGNGNFTADGTMDSTQFNSATTTLNGVNTLTYNNAGGFGVFKNLIVGQSGNTTTINSTLDILTTLNVGSGTLTGSSFNIYLDGSNPLIFNVSSTVSVNTLQLEGTSQTIPTLTNGYDCGLRIATSNSTVTQTGNITINSPKGLTLDTINRTETWNTAGYNLTVGGNISIGDTGDTNLHKLDATGSGGRTSTITVGGNWLNYGNGTASSTFIAASSTVIFNATSTGKTITSGSSTSPFNNLIFNGTGGGWTLQDNLTATSTTLTKGTLVDNGKTVTVNGNISISGSAGSVLTSTGNWIQGASGNLSNPGAASNSFYALTIAGSGVTTTFTDNVNVGYASNQLGTLTLGPGNLNASGYNLYAWTKNNDFLTVNNLVMGSALHTFQLKASANITQKAIILPNNFVTAISGILFKLNGSNITATGNFNFGNNSVGVESETSGAPVNYLDMGSYSLTAGTLYLGLATNNGYIKLGSSASNSISGILISGTGASHILDLGTGTTTVSDNIDFTGINVTPGTSNVTLSSSSAQIVTSSAQTFNNLTIANTSAGGVTFADRLQTARLTDVTDVSTIKFSAASIGAPHTISTALNITGGASKITLAPATASTAWYISAPVGTSVSNAIVSYSNSTNHITPLTCTDGGHNVNWDFDATAPTTTSTATSNGSGYAFGNWTKHSVNVILTCADNDGGVGCDTANYPKYCVGAIDCVPTTHYTSPVAISTEGVSYIRYYSADTIPNAETVKSSVIWIDTIAPTVTDDVPSGWQNTDFTTILSCDDSTGGNSGCSKVFYTLDGTDPDSSSPLFVNSASSWQFIYSTSTKSSATLKYRGLDTAGNLESVVTALNLLEIDKLHPVISNIDPASGASIAKSGQVVTFTLDKTGDCRAATAAKSYDGMSGDITCSVVNGIQISCNLPDFTPGVKNIYFACKDYLGNKDNASSATGVAYTVPEPPGGAILIFPTIPPLPETTPGLTPAPAPVPTMPTAPAGPFKVLINNGATVVTRRKVTLDLSAISGATAVVLADNPDFANAIIVPFKNSLEYDLCNGQGVCLNQNYTIYAKFLDSSGANSPAIAVSTYLRLPTVVIPEKNLAQQLLSQLPSLIGGFKPVQPVKLNFPPINISVPSTTPIAFNQIRKLTLPAMQNFIMAPLPADFLAIAHKFPEVAGVLKQVGITKMNDAGQLESARISLPGLAEAAGLPTAQVGLPAGQEVLPPVPSVPIASLTQAQSNKLPSNVVFARLDNLDLNVKLSISNSGAALQTVNAISGHPLTLAIKPDSQAKSVKGYLIFKSDRVAEGAVKKAVQPKKTAQRDAIDLLATPASAMEVNAGVDIGANADESAPAVNSGSPDLVVNQFDYKESANGIWTADVASPAVLGQYELRTVVDYTDKAKQPETVSMVVVVDPEGYVYRKLNDGSEARILGSVVSIYWLNPKNNQYELWPAKDYRQANPQTTDVTGRYAFLVPPGQYYLKATAVGYGDYQSDSFKVEENKGVFMNLELKTKVSWTSWVSLQNILLGGILLVLIYVAAVFTFWKRK